jgi:molybdenum cofactor biosynthesis protein B
MSAAQHQARADETPVACAVVTVSDTRTEETDRSGVLVKDRLRAAGYPVEFYRIVPDEGEAIRAVLLHLVGQVEVVVTTGGTGISRRDTTTEVADRLIQKPLPGFGEIFRTLSFNEIGPAAMLSRATAGLYGAEDGPAETLLFCCPGSPGAAALAVERLIVPDLRHVVWQVVQEPARTASVPPTFPL